MHTTLYRKWRPADFDSVVGQNMITDVLRYQVAQGKVSHAYLFTGTRGTGKTSCAKILAKAVNCLEPVNGNPCGKCEACRFIDSGSATDIVEFDAASNTGVDFIRDIREEVVYAPSVLKKKVYIIDEVHMLSASAFNAFLKTLEEPPEHVMFIFATTEVHKLPITIISRCQRFDFRRIGVEDISSRLKYIASQENINITETAVRKIALLAKGGMRDAISLFELCSGAGKTIDEKLVIDVLGVPDRSYIDGIVRCVAEKNNAGIFRGVETMASLCTDISVFWQQLLSYYRDMLVMLTCPPETASKLLELTDEETALTKKRTESFTREKIIRHMKLIEDAYLSMQRAGQIKRTTAEMTLIRMSDDRLDDSNESLLSRISELERKMTSGARPVSPAAEKVEEPAPQPVEEPEEKKEEPKKDGRADLDGWSDIVSEIISRDPFLGSHLRGSQAYLDGNKLVVCTTEFAAMIIKNDANVLSLIAEAVNESGEAQNVNPTNITFEKIKPPKTEKTAIDELI